MSEGMQREDRDDDDDKSSMSPGIGHFIESGGSIDPPQLVFATGASPAPFPPCSECTQCSKAVLQSCFDWAGLDWCGQF